MKNSSQGVYVSDGNEIAFGFPFALAQTSILVYSINNFQRNICPAIPPSYDSASAKCDIHNPSWAALNG
jgi:hypothetical protein